MTDDNNFMARVEQAVRHNISNDTEIIGVIFDGFMSQRADYWERRYFVAWKNDRESGTHAANIDNLGMSALFYGHYGLDNRSALEDMIERAGLSVERF